MPCGTRRTRLSCGRDPDDRLIPLHRERSEPVRAAQRTTPTSVTRKGDRHEEGSTAPHARRGSRVCRGRRGARRRGRAIGGESLEPQGSSADRGRPGRRQHGRLRVREPGQAEHRHDHRELHPVRGSGGRAELLPVRSDRALRLEHRQQRRRARRRRVPLPVQDAGVESEHLSLQHRADRHAGEPGRRI